MSGLGRDDGLDGPPAPSHRSPNPYVAPPHIRTTGEVPAVTGEFSASDIPDPYRNRGDGSSDPGDPWSLGGSVVDRPAPSPPDWMSGVQVPELLVTRDLDPSELAANARESSPFVETAQRVVGLVLVAVLVAIVALVLASSILGF